MARHGHHQGYPVDDDFRNNSAEFLTHIKETGRPLGLTVNGRAAAVLQDAAAYQRLLDIGGG